VTDDDSNDDDRSTDDRNRDAAGTRDGAGDDPRVPDPGAEDDAVDRDRSDEGSANRHGTDRDEPLGELSGEIDDVAPPGEDRAGRPGGREGPMSDVANELEADAEAEDGAPNPADQLFEEVEEVGEIDREALWRQVAGEDVAADAAEELDGEVVDAGSTGPTIKRPETGGEAASDEGVHERIVEKAKYCQGCEYFSAPPEVRCTHEGTEIVEMVDVAHFRVVDCPIVKEDEELENA